MRPGEEVLVMEAMKMQHSITADIPGIVRAFAVDEGETVFEGEVLAFLEERPELGSAIEKQAEIDLDYIRPDLAESQCRSFSSSSARQLDWENSP